MLLKFGTDGRQISVEVEAPDMIQKGTGVNRLRLLSSSTLITACRSESPSM